MKSFFNQVDVWLGRTVAFFVVPVMYLSFAVLTVLMFMIIIEGGFEYREGILDLDRLEVLLYTSIVVISYRFFCRGRMLKWSYWRLTKHYCFATALVLLITTFISSLILMVLVMADGKITLAQLSIYKDETFFILGVTLVIALYAATPLPPLFQSKRVTNEAQQELQTDSMQEGLASADKTDISDPWSSYGNTPKN